MSKERMTFEEGLQILLSRYDEVFVEAWKDEDGASGRVVAGESTSLSFHFEEGDTFETLTDLVKKQGWFITSIHQEFNKDGSWEHYFTFTR